MCLFVTITPCEPDFNRGLVKRILKSASVLSAYPKELDGRPVFYLGHSSQCACDLLAADGGANDGRQRLSPTACDALVRVARAVVEAGQGPFEFRAFWADERAADVIDLNLEGFVELVRANEFDGLVSYRVGDLRR
jgi:hypothetical protein